MPPHSPVRSHDLLSAAESLLLVIDMQERLLPSIIDGDGVTANCARLLKGAALFGVPVALSEQYPKGLGRTVAEIAGLVGPGPPRVEKLHFSAADAVGWPTAGEREDGRHQVVLAGVEAHVCVLQTAFDLLSRGYRVFVVADAAGSRSGLDRDTALQRLRDGGVTIVTTESVLFEWCEAAGTDAFRVVRDLVKGT